MSFWPGSLVTEIAERRAVIFVGAGATAAAKTASGTKPPTWSELLEKAKSELLSDAADIAEVTRLIGNGQLLDAAEVVFRSVNGAEYRRFMNEVFVHPKFSPSRIHELIRDIDVRFLVTTNYDTLLEQACGASGYSVRRHHDANVLNVIRSPESILLKAHGCVTHVDKTIITRTHYHNARQDHSFFYKVLDSLLLLHTTLFVGASLSDPDIQLVLENAALSVRCDHPHYALMPRGQHAALREVTRTAYNIQILEYDYDPTKRDHSDCARKLEELCNDVNALRLKYAGRTP